MQTYHLIIPPNLKPKPTQHEIIVAKIMMEHFKSDARFIPRAASTTPDLLILRTHQDWEIKNIRGNSKRTIQNNLRNAKQQSENIIISLRLTQMTPQQAERRINQYLKDGPVPIRRIFLISKTNKIIAIK